MRAAEVALAPAGAYSEDQARSLADLGHLIRGAGISLASVLPAPHAGPDVSAILTVTQWEHDSSTAPRVDELAAAHRRGNTAAAVEIVTLRTGPAVRAVQEHARTAECDHSELVARGVTYIVPWHRGGLTICVSTCHLAHWEFFARQATLVAETAYWKSLRL